MRCGSLFAVLVVVLAGCPGGDGAIGDHCSDRGDCSGGLQCVAATCVPKCARAPDCGDGYSCDKDGYCHAAAGQLGDSCTSEVDCAAGLACELEGSATDPSGRLLASCVAENPARPAGSECASDADCRNGTCALGHCVDLCSATSDCGRSTSCALIPRVEADGAMFAGCLQAHGSMRWDLPVHGTSDTVALPIPSSAQSVVVTFSVDDPDQLVGAEHVVAPDGTVAVSAPGNYYTDPVRHKLELGQSVLAMPSSPDAPLQAGEYTLSVVSKHGANPGTATPTATAVVKLDATGTDANVILDLHFYFLNLDEHPCADKFQPAGKLDAATASTAAFFQTDFLDMLRGLFASGGVPLGAITYEDLRDHPDLDGLDQANAPALLALGSHAVGVNVFFVRTLSPVGLQAIGPSPGPAGLANTRQSGIVIGVDTLCYRSWQDLARLTAHEVARYMGLYDNVEIDPTHTDPIRDNDDEDASTNLMFYSELGGYSLSPGQRDILRRSPVLR
jgi:hypothetical protein